MTFWHNVVYSVENSYIFIANVLSLIFKLHALYDHCVSVPGFNEFVIQVIFQENINLDFAPKAQSEGWATKNKTAPCANNAF